MKIGMIKNKFQSLFMKPMIHSASLKKKTF